MKRIYSSIILMVGLAGCDATGQLGAEGSPMWQLRTLSPEARLAYFEEKCATYGYRRGTDAMRDCIADENRSWNN